MSQTVTSLFTISARMKRLLWIHVEDYGYSVQGSPNLIEVQLQYAASSSKNTVTGCI